MQIIRESSLMPSVDLLEHTIEGHPENDRWGSFLLVAATALGPAMSLLSRLAPQQRSRTIVMVAAATTPPDEWALLDAGAGDVLSLEQELAVEAAVARLQRWAIVDAAMDSPVVRSRFVGDSTALRAALCELVEAAVFGSAPVVLIGETGTGKELAAEAIHDLTCRGRETAQLVVVDCTTIVPTLSGSELFGHEKGAFTGADRARVGAVKQADGGTLFLDEIGELPPVLQAELLRVLETGRFKTVGGSNWGSASFRLVSATHRDLGRDQRHGRFRSDLYHRIAASVIRLPPLRERLEDVPSVFAHFLTLACGHPLELSSTVTQCLCEREYPGNIRELRQLALQVAARHVGPGPVTIGDLPPATRTHQRRDPAAKLRSLVRRQLNGGHGLRELTTLVGDLAVEVALTDTGGNVRLAAQRLGVTPRALQLRLKHD